MRNLKKCFYVLLTVILVSEIVNAQSVAINSDASKANTSAMLDIKSTTKGMLIPRMNSLQRSAIVTPASGLLVFDITTNSFWFYNSSVWKEITTASNGWNLTGNSGTNPVNNFIGTTDNKLLIFKVNNNNAGAIDEAGANAFFGSGSGRANSTGKENVGLGAGTLVNNIAGSRNTALGDSAMYSFAGNTVNSNTAVGTHTLFSSTNSIANTAIGGYSMVSVVDGGYNTAVGLNTLTNNISGDSNTAVGSRALQFTTGSRNTAIGTSALRFNSLASNNTALGFEALYFNTGTENTAAGAYALHDNSAGYGSSAFGLNALQKNTLGNTNTAMGWNALASNTVGSNNVAIGTGALGLQRFANNGINYITSNVAVGSEALVNNNPTSINNAKDNTAIGTAAMYSNLTGNSNTAVGNKALYLNTVSALNTAIGDNALYNNRNGYQNTGVGYQALYNNDGGSFNTAFGGYALANNTSGGFNVAIGVNALDFLVTGSNNIAIGAGCGTAQGSPGINNTISIGNYNYDNAASNQVFIGDRFVSFIGGNVNFTTYSDERIKTNIKEEVAGLDFIKRLRPVTYYRSSSQFEEITGQKHTRPDYPEKYDIEKIKFTGFLAQEVERAANASHYDFSGIHKPKNEHDLYGLSYAEFVVPLVKAMQEQQQMIEDLHKKMIDMQAEILVLKAGSTIKAK